MKTKNLPLYILGVLIVFGYFGLLVVLTYKTVPVENSALYNNAMGVLLASFSLVVGYYFGSSKGSQEKNEMLLKTEPPKNDPPEPPTPPIKP